MILIDAKGDICPMPVIKTKKALKTADEGETVQITVDNEIASQNIEKMAKELKCKFMSLKVSKDEYIIKIVKNEDANFEEVKEITENSRDITNLVVVISSDKMGSGSDELGEALIKTFIYALSEEEKSPETIIFYNGGVKLTTESSLVLEDLYKMEQKGTKIISCGACLNYYDLQDKLKVGEVSNMYEILNKMSKADKIIKP